MMESANGMAQSSDSNVQATSQQPVTTSQPATSAPAQEHREERTFRQTEVNDIVKRAKSEAIDSFRRMQTERPDYVEQKYGDMRQPQVTQPQTQQFDGSPDERIRKLVAEESARHLENARLEALRQHQDQQAQKTVQNFWNKVLPGREKYQDFDKIAGDIDFKAFPNVVQLLGDYVDNSGDVLYELGKDRIKMANLEQLANMSPRDAIVQVQRMSESIRDNETASKVRLPNEPLSQMRPTNAGTDNGAMSVSDYRKKYKV